MTARRDSLYDRLTEVLGNDHASTLMSPLPDESPATKSDIAHLRTQLRGDIADLRREMRDDMGAIRSEIGRLDDRIHRFYDALHARTRVHVAASPGSAVTVAGLVFIATQST